MTRLTSQCKQMYFILCMWYKMRVICNCWKYLMLLLHGNSLQNYWVLCEIWHWSPQIWSHKISFAGCVGGVLLKLLLLENMKNSFQLMWVRPSVSITLYCPGSIFEITAEKRADPLSIIFSPGSRIVLVF